MIKSLAVVMMLFVSSAFAQDFKAQSFEDQFGDTIELTAQTQWVLFAHDKQSADWAHQALTELGLEDLSAQNGLYVSDISAMPGFVTKMFALPKMKKYPYRLALDKSGEQTGDWPKTEGTLSLIKLDGLKLVETSTANSPEQVKAFISAF